MFVFSPSPDYRYAFKRGMSGNDVAVLQLNLGVTVDGDFGTQTHRAVKRFQRENGLLVDAIAGLSTQQRLIVKRSASAEDKFRLPKGMLKSIANNETGFAIAAFAWHPSDEGFDIGAFQKSVSPSRIGDQDLYRAAYKIRSMAVYTAQEIRAIRDQFEKPVDSWYKQTLAKGNRSRFRWMLAILNHNWPYAADNISRTGSIFNDPDRDDAYADWVHTASAGRLSTARQWVVSYVQRSTVFIRSW